jgi:hypothetical protein
MEDNEAKYAIEREKTRRTVIRWSSISGIIVLFLIFIAIAGISR